MRGALLRNEGFDRIVLELLTAEGSNSRREDDYHGATNYLLALTDDSGVRPTVEVCRVLLGRNSQCAQCHDDPQSDLRQEDFWQFAAFFRQTEIQSLGAGRFRLTDQDFDGDLIDGVRVAGTVGYQQPDGSWQRVAPAFPGGEPIRSQGRVQNRDYRRDLARQLIASDDLSRAIVNRLWSQFFQYGLTIPVDDMGRHNPGGTRNCWMSSPTSLWHRVGICAS